MLDRADVPLPEGGVEAGRQATRLVRVTPRLFARWVALVLVLILAGAACGGDREGGDRESPAPTPPTTRKEMTGLEAARKLWAEVPQHVRWQVTTITAGQEEHLTIELWWNPDKDRSRVDLSWEDGSGTVIGLPDRMVFCDHREKQCVALTGIEGPVPPGMFLPMQLPGIGGFTPDVIDAFLARLVGTRAVAGRRQVAGVKARCWKGSAGDLEEWEVCFPPDGGPMLYGRAKERNGNQAEMEALSFDQNVPDGTFEPPYLIQETPFPTFPMSVPTLPGGTLPGTPSIPEG